MKTLSAYKNLNKIKELWESGEFEAEFADYKVVKWSYWYGVQITVSINIIDRKNNVKYGPYDLCYSDFELPICDETIWEFYAENEDGEYDENFELTADLVKDYVDLLNEDMEGDELLDYMTQKCEMSDNQNFWTVVENSLNSDYYFYFRKYMTTNKTVWADEPRVI